MDTEKIIREALIHHGFTPSSASALIGKHDAAVLEDSDHSAYRELADEIGEVIGAVSDSDQWDWDASELEILKTFVTWLPDMIRHQEAQRLRVSADKTDPGTDPHVASLRRLRARAIADWLDPFEPNAYGWRRKRTGEPVPTPVAPEES